MQGDVFGLNRLYELQVLNSMGTETIQSSTIDYGYFGGGYTPTIINTFSRLDLSTEVASSLPAQLPIATRSLTALSSSSYGYYAGGVTSTPATVCTISRLDFSNDSISSPGSYQLTEARQRLASVSNANYGYFGGGTNAATTIVNTVDRIDFSTETVAARTNDLTQARSRLVAVPSTNYGYFNGGEITVPANACTIDRIDFTTETTSVAVNYSRVLRRAYGATFSNSYGYFAGGQSPAPAYLNTMDRLDFSTEVTSSPGKNLVESKGGTGGVSGSLYGYFVSGFTPTVTTSIERLEFSTETVTNLSGAKLPSGRGDFGSVTGSRSLNLTRNYFSESAAYGYFGGGSVGGSIPIDNRSIIDRIDYSSETISTPGSVLSFAVRGADGVSSDINAYIFLDNSDINRLNYSTDLVTTITSRFFGGGYWGATSQTNSYGYVTGNVNNLSRVDRLDFSTEVYSSPGKKLFGGRRSHFGNVYNSSYGYFGGGTNQPSIGPTAFCTIERLDFSTEIMTLTNQFITGSTSSALSSNFYGYITTSSPPSFTNRLDFSTETIQNKLTSISTTGTGTSTNSFGYFAGGLPSSGASPYSSNVVRLNFSDETTSTLTSKLSQGRVTLAAVSGGQSQRVFTGRTTGTYGYFGGGPALSSKIDRLDLSTEIVSSPASVLTAVKRAAGGISSNLYGYFGGGYNNGPTNYCLIDRLEFSTETISAPGKNLTQARWGLSGAFNNSYGYFAGGLIPGTPSTFYCTIDRLDFSNETIFSPAFPAKLNVVRGRHASTYNNSYGYFGGGTSIPGSYCTIDRLDFSTETTRLLRNNLSQNRYGLAAVSSSSYGYYVGGYSLSEHCTIDRLDFSTETTSVPGKQLLTATGFLTGVTGNSYGYFGGGNLGGSCTISRLDFLTETVSEPGKNLSEIKADPAAVSTEQRASTVDKGFSSFTATYGYFAGSEAPGSPPIVTNTVNRLDFSNQTVSLPGNNLTQGRGRLGATSSSSYGYFGGGTVGGALNTIDRIEFSTETASAPGRNLIKANSTLTAFSSSYYGYFGAGVQYKSSFQRLDFSNETTSEPGNQLTQGRDSAASISSGSYGYIVGGSTASPPPAISSIERLDFSTETYSVPGYNLPDTRSDSAAVGSNSYAYFGAGNVATGPNTATITSTIDRLDFSTEISSRLTSRFPSARSNLAATTSASYGYFGGGSPPATSPTIIRFDIFNETISNTSKTLPVAGSGIAAVSSAYKPPIRNGWGWRKTYGYFGGGISQGPIYLNTIDRLDFSSETMSLPGKNLTQARGALSTVSNNSYGYFAGGSNPSLTPTFSNIIDRLDFSSETTSAPGNNISQLKNQFAAVSSDSYGYFAGGNTGSAVNTVDRLDFSTETRLLPGKNLTQPRALLSGIFNVSYGYFGGGNPQAPAVQCTIDRLDFSTETVSAPVVSPGQLTQAREALAASSSGSYGYFGGGVSTGISCTIDRLDFSNETTSAPGKNLPNARIRLSAVSSGSYGYFGGGTLSSIIVSNVARIDFSTETIISTNDLTGTKTELAGIQAN